MIKHRSIKGKRPPKGVKHTVTPHGGKISFGIALDQVKEGFFARRLCWEERDWQRNWSFVAMHDGELNLYDTFGHVDTWSSKTADILADDWSMVSVATDVFAPGEAEAVADKSQSFGFDWAFECMKRGVYVTRAGWNQPDMYLYIATGFEKLEDILVMYTHDNKHVPWKPEQGCLLAEDWTYSRYSREDQPK